MGYDINEDVRNAQTELHQAIAALDAARANYQHGAGAAYAQAVALQADLFAKIRAADQAAATAESDFLREFAAAGYERNDAVREALSRKGDAVAMADAMRAALAQREQDTRAHLIHASEQGRAYVNAHDAAQGAYARAEAYQALGEAGEKIARAMALCSHVPQQGSAYEDSLGRMHLSEASDAEIRAARWAFILKYLATMAKACPEYGERPVVPALGVLDLGALSARDFVSPARAQMMRKAA
ncbi:MAG: hypothetical protein EOO29_42450 [Comamonadaceae bacterium]|nr:MAG: hypothetical protein EOO29_42450 [Comamonadaceae bacterium]